MLEIRKCTCRADCAGWVASYLRWECERDCPIAACAAVLEAELDTAGGLFAGGEGER